TRRSTPCSSAACRAKAQPRRPRTGTPQKPRLHEECSSRRLLRSSRRTAPRHRRRPAISGLAGWSHSRACCGHSASLFHVSPAATFRPFSRIIEAMSEHSHEKFESLYAAFPVHPPYVRIGFAAQSFQEEQKGEIAWATRARAG